MDSISQMIESAKPYMEKAGEYAKTAAPYLSAGASLAQGVSGYMAGSENARRAELEGKQAMEAGRENYARQRREVALKQASLRAKARGDMTGSPLEVYLANAKQGELMAQDNLYAARLKRLSKQYQAVDSERMGLGAFATGAANAASTLFK